MTFNIFIFTVLSSILLSDAAFILSNIHKESKPASKKWILNIVHTNDMHSRFEETNAMSATCTENDKNLGQCYGGFPRIATLVREARKSPTPALFLNAGDTYQGSAWFIKYQWEVVAKFLNILKPDAATLGNHEFDLGPKGLVPFLNNAAFPIVACNLDFSKEPELAATNVTKSIVLNVEGRKIAIIGYLTPDTKAISHPANVIFHDEIESLKKEIKKLKNEQKVDIFIGLGHSGYEVDKKIAKEVEDLDLIIGGHSHSFLYTGKIPSSEVPAGLYPTEIVQKSGRRVYVVQAYAFTKYLGNIFVSFDEYGEIDHIEGRPILVDKSIKEATDVLDELNKMKPALKELTQRTVAYTKVVLNGSRALCRNRECSMGNLITDAMIDYYQTEYAGDDGWTDTAIAIHNSGSVRGSIIKGPNQPITYDDVLTVLPFGNVMGKTILTGRQIFKMLEHSVAEFGPGRTDFSGQFLHFSGLQVAYDITQPVGSRVLPNSVYVRCAKCKEPEYERLQWNKKYSVAMHNFLYEGGNGYNMFKTPFSTWASSGLPMDQVLALYLEKIKYLIHMGTERRIKFANRSDCDARRKRSNKIFKTQRQHRPTKTSSGTRRVHH
ncbi:protein 5NUC-like [Chelonus insularis]|uniref:protein 5NUC-like n=1 Tax=Chelonus insularis TaxID=460826 RepID=UPI00158E4194|nr:protein 5NUC-like [Chelonus insularis]